jgi:D-3-phosphoglycerate dehydrogenase
MRLVLCYPVEPKHKEQIAAIVPDWEIVDAGQERIAELLPTADVFCGHAKVPVDWADVVSRGRLQWIQSSAAGVDHCLTPEVIASDIPVSSASGVLADQVAEQTFALMLGLLRSMPVFHAAQQKHEYIRRPTRDLHRATVLIVGFGGNGRRLAETLAPFRTRIWATDLFPILKPEIVERLEPADKLDELLPEVDIVILTAPLNASTRGMFDEARINRMKAGSLLVNVARGPLVVESALPKALDSGRLGGVGMDVAEVEPLAKDSPLWDRQDVIITPHVGGQSARRIDDMTDFFCENLVRWRAGEPLLNLVDKTLGFPHPENSPAALRVVKSL